MIPKNALRAVLRYSEAQRRLNMLEVARLHGRPVEANQLRSAENLIVETREAAVDEISKVEGEASTLLAAIAAKGGT